MSYAEIAPFAWLVLAPASTALLVTDLRTGVATSRYRRLTRAQNPIQYRLILGVNVLIMAVAWYQLALVLLRWVP